MSKRNGILVTTMVLLLALSFAVISAETISSEGNVFSVGDPITFDDNDLMYTVNEDGETVTLTGPKEGGSQVSGKLTLYSEANDGSNSYTVTAIGNNAFKDRKSSGTLSIPGTIKTIGDYAFYDCRTFDGNLSIPNGVTSIGKYAFSLSTWRDGLILPDSITRIEEGTFHGNLFSTNLTLPKNLTYIGDKAFYSNPALKGSLTIPDDVTYIGNYAFDPDSGVHYPFENGTLTMGKKVETIGERAFNHTGFKGNLTIPESVKSIGANAFLNTPKFEGTLTMYGGTSIGDCAFKDAKFSCLHTGIDWSNVICTGSPFSGCKFTKLIVDVECLDKAIFDYIDKTQITEFELTNNVVTIKESLFSDCTGLSAITIPNSVESIEEYAFSGCTGLSTITIPNSVKSIGKYAFSGCTGLSSVALSQNANYTAISDGVFASTGLTSLEIPNNVTSIGANAFQKCSSLLEISIPNSIGSIGEYAFSGCTGLSSITLPQNAYFTAISDGVFASTGLTSVEIPNNVTSIGAKAFQKCSSLLEISIPNSIESIGEYAFSDCTGLSTITIPNSVKSIGTYAFSGCTELSSITLPQNDNFTAISDGVFANTGLTSVEIPNSVTSIGAHAFYNCVSLTSDLIFSENIKSIGAHAFEGCTKLGTLTISESLLSIGEYAFGNCVFTCLHTCVDWTNPVCDATSFSGCKFTKLIVDVECLDKAIFDYIDKTQITVLEFTNSVVTIQAELCKDMTGIKNLTMPNSVKSIGTYAFSGCTGLSSITLPQNDNFTAISDGVFADTGLTSLEIPNTVTSIGAYAFYNCVSLTSDLIFSENIKSIGAYAFQNCAGIKKLVLSKNPEFTTIDEYVFAGCGLTCDLEIPQNIKSIGAHAFEGCTKLGTLTISETSPSIGEYAFGNCVFACLHTCVDWKDPVCDVTSFSNCKFTKLIVDVECLDKAIFNYIGRQITAIEFTNSVVTIQAELCKDMTSLKCGLNNGFPNSVTILQNHLF